MKEITLRIQDQDLDKFMELVSTMDIEIQHEVSVPEFHKNIVRDRITHSNQEDLKSWNEAQQGLEYKKRK